MRKQSPDNDANDEENQHIVWLYFVWFHHSLTALRCCWIACPVFITWWNYQLKILRLKEATQHGWVGNVYCERVVERERENEDNSLVHCLYVLILLIIHQTMIHLEMNPMKDWKSSRIRLMICINLYIILWSGTTNPIQNDWRARIIK